MGAVLNVRPVRPEEHERVAALTVAAYRAVRDVGDYAAVLADVADRVRHAEVLVAVDDDGTVLGSVTNVPDGGRYGEIARAGEAEFRMLAVDPEAQRRGAGEALVRACVDDARRRGRSAVVLSSDASMTAAHRMYERLGFAREPERDWAPMPDVDLRAYRLDLVRPARPEEYDAIADLTVEVYSSLDGGLHPEYAAILRRTAERAATAEVLVAVEGEGPLLGSVTYVPEPGPQASIATGDEAEFRTLVVSPKAQGQGVGRGLVQWSVDRARRDGRERLVLSTMPWMRVAHGLYERMGFVRTPERDWHPRPEVDCWTYALDL
ncbi:MAG TPA: GNAT family N-acetyltransferase [Frankiaceae bacterium]|nr:GNAT family N-acetyltransferase [Frankiaceae bacterium]